MYFHYFILFILLSFSHCRHLYEDDMELSTDQLSMMKGRGIRNVWAWSAYYWPNSTLVYTIANDIRKCV